MNKSIIISRRVWVDTLTEWDFINTYHIDIKEAALTFKEKLQQLKFLNVNSTHTETVLSNEIIIYEISNIVNQFEILINEFSLLWDDYENAVNISKHRWMQVSLKFDIKMFTTVKVYFLESKNCEVVNKILNKLHSQEKLFWTENHTSSEYSVFVVWQNVVENDKIIKKKQLIVNLWNLNKITKSDFYFISL